MNILKRKKLEKICKEIDEAKENILKADTEAERNLWDSLRILAEMELGLMRIK